MGFFNKLFGNNDENKETCVICGSQLPSRLIPFNGTEQLADGRICKICASQISPWVSGFKMISASQMADHLEYRRTNREMLNSFIETYRLKFNNFLIAVDLEHQWILFSHHDDYLNYNADILDWSQISGAQIEIRETVFHKTEHVPDRQEPIQKDEYNYRFGCEVSVNSNWFRTISFVAGRSSSIEIIQRDDLYRAYDDVCSLCRLFDQLGIPYNYMDRTSFGMDAIISGAAMEMIMNPMGAGPVPGMNAGPVHGQNPAPMPGHAAGPVHDQGMAPMPGNDTPPASGKGPNMNQPPKSAPAAASHHPNSHPSDGPDASQPTRTPGRNEPSQGGRPSGRSEAPQSERFSGRNDYPQDVRPSGRSTAPQPTCTSGRNEPSQGGRPSSSPNASGSARPTASSRSSEPAHPTASSRSSEPARPTASSRPSGSAANPSGNTRSSASSRPSASANSTGSARPSSSSRPSGSTNASGTSRQSARSSGSARPAGPSRPSGSNSPRSGR